MIDKDKCTEEQQTWGHMYGRGGGERERERKLSSEEVISLKFHEKRFEWSSVYVLCGFYMNFF